MPSNLSAFKRVNLGLQKFILQSLPDFVWVTTHDILLIAELEYPDIDEGVLKSMISQMKRSGLLEKREHGAKPRHQVLLGDDISRATGKCPFALYRRVASVASSA